jgi:hypothetical protein
VKKQEVLQIVNVGVPLIIHHAIHMRKSVMWPAQLYTIFPHYLTEDTIFGGKKVIERKMNVLISSTTFV